MTFQNCICSAESDEESAGFYDKNERCLFRSLKELGIETMKEPTFHPSYTVGFEIKSFALVLIARSVSFKICRAQ